MDGREKGYIKFFRSVESSDDFIGMRPDQCWVAVRIVQLANYRPAVARLRCGAHHHAVPVGRGELAHSLETIAARTGATIKVVRTTINRLLKSGFLSARHVDVSGTPSGTPLRVLKVVNYETFQPIDDEEGTPLGASEAHLGHTSGTPRALSKEGEEGEEGRNLCAEDASGASPPAPSSASQVPLLALVEPPSPVVTVMPCVGTGPREFAVTEALVAEWQAAFPAVDVRAKVRVLAQWARDNPKKRKTHGGARSFFSRNLSSEQDKATRGNGPAERSPQLPVLS